MTQPFLVTETPDSFSSRQEILGQIQSSRTRYDAWLSRIGIRAPEPAEKVSKDFLSLAEDQLLQIESRFRHALHLMEASFPGVEGELGSGPVATFSKQSELMSLKRALTAAGLRMADDKFADYLDEDDIFEVFSETGTQLYRSWSCYKYCSYSALELKMYDWDELYIRPAWVAKTLWDLAPKLFEPGAKTIAYNIPEYVMTERLHRDKRSLLFQMKYASPLIHESTGRTTAFISTGKLTVLTAPSPNSDILIL